jgi:DNA-binding LacI/PurR family transcriptional regulator
MPDSATKSAKPKKQRVTIMDVAKEAGVSIAAVSRILNNSYEGFSAREETKERVYAAVKKLNYKASRAAVRLATGRHQAIALCYPDDGFKSEAIDPGSITTIFGQLGQMLQIRGVSRAAALHNMDLVLMIRNRERSLEELLRQAADSVDGILYVNPENDPKVAKELESSELPVAVVGPMTNMSSKFISVRVDEYLAGRMAMGHLIVAGARKIVVAIPENQAKEMAIIRRMEGVENVAQSYSDPNLKFDKVILPANMELAKSAFHNHIGKWGRIDGVLTLGGVLPFPIINALFEEKLRVPEEVKVVGFDENPMFQLHTPSITGIRYPIEEMCHRATQLLLERIKGEAVPEPETMKPKMIARKSSEAPFFPLV